MRLAVGAVNSALESKPHGAIQGCRFYKFDSQGERSPGLMVRSLTLRHLATSDLAKGSWRVGGVTDPTGGIQVIRPRCGNENRAM
jgi:hypothetical protein